MNKQKLLTMICQYVAFKESIIHAYYDKTMKHSLCAEDRYYSLISDDDDKWQEIVNYVYADEKEEE